MGIDKLYHLIAGLFIAKVLITMGLRNSLVLLGVLAVAICKELTDTNIMSEHIKDILFTVIPVLFIIPRK